MSKQEQEKQKSTPEMYMPIKEIVIGGVDGSMSTSYAVGDSISFNCSDDLLRDRTISFIQDYSKNNMCKTFVLANKDEQPLAIIDVPVTNPCAVLFGEPKDIEGDENKEISE